MAASCTVASKFDESAFLSKFNFTGSTASESRKKVAKALKSRDTNELRDHIELRRSALEALRNKRPEDVAEYAANLQELEQAADQLDRAVLPDLLTCHDMQSDIMKCSGQADKRPKRPCNIHVSVACHSVSSKS